MNLLIIMNGGINMSIYTEAKLDKETSSILFGKGIKDTTVF